METDKHKAQAYNHLQKALIELKKAGDVCRMKIYPDWQSEEIAIEKAVDAVENILCNCKGIN